MRAVVLVTLMAACNHDAPAGTSDARTRRDLSARFEFPEEDASADDLADPPDLEPPPEPAHCPPICDGGPCIGRCRSGDGGLSANLVALGMAIEHIGGDLRLSVCVSNQGQVAAPVGVPVSFRWAIEDPLIATVKTQTAIAPGEAETVTWLWVNPPHYEGSCAAWADIDDDGSGHGIVDECREDDNRSLPVDTKLCGPG